MHDRRTHLYLLLHPWLLGSQQAGCHGGGSEHGHQAREAEAAAAGGWRCLLLLLPRWRRGGCCNEGEGGMAARGDATVGFKVVARDVRASHCAAADSSTAMSRFILTSPRLVARFLCCGCCAARCRGALPQRRRHAAVGAAFGVCVNVSVWTVLWELG